MAIQFPCPACNQPIEVDDQWANCQVTCPYCQKVVTAPERSELEPAGGAGPAAVPEPVELVDNPWGRWGLICGVVALGIFVILICAGLRAMKPVMDDLRQRDQSPEAVQQEVQRIVQDELRNEPLLLVGSAVLTLVALAGTIISVVGLTRRRAKKSSAIAGVVICGSFLSCQCLGMLMQLLAR